MTKRSNVTIQDVARAAGVSVSTVSRVLNDKDDVAPATYARVQQTIERLEYTSSLAARSMRSRKTGVIGLVALDLDDPFAIEVMKGVDRAVQRTGCDLIVYTGGYRDRGESETRAAWEQRHVSLLNGSITDGAIVVTPTAVEFPTTSPLVAIDPHSHDGDYPAVIATNHAGAVEMTRYLLDLGHRRIGFVEGRPGLRSASQRLEGYRQALQDAGVPVDPALIRPGDYRRETGFARARELLTLPAPPSAVFCANDESAIGAIEAARELGLRVPEDVSVAGFDDAPEAARTAPPLTTVAQPMHEIGFAAAEMLAALIRGETPDDRVRQVPTKLIIRESCQAI